MPSSPHDLFAEAIADAGWTLTLRRPFGGGPNPTQFEIRRGRERRRLFVYAWRITLEGKGRRRAGRKDIDYRIQTTRTHDGPLMTPVGYVGCGIGWDEERDVFGAFDLWAKRETGRSSSVHFQRSLLDGAATAGWAEVDREDGPEAAFNPSFFDRFLSWAVALKRPELQLVTPETFNRLGNEAEIVVDPWIQKRANRLRPGDHIVAEGDSGLLDDSIWIVRSIEARQRATASARYNRPLFLFRCVRHGVIVNADLLTTQGAR